MGLNSKCIPFIAFQLTGALVSTHSHLRTFSSLADLELAIHPSSPKLVITVPTTLSHGYSRQLFVHFAQTKGNIVILTSKSEEGSLARWLWSLWNEQQVEGEKWGQGKVGKVTELNQTVDLEVSLNQILPSKSETKMKDNNNSMTIFFLDESESFPRRG